MFKRPSWRCMPISRGGAPPAAGLPRRTGWLALTGGAGALVFGCAGFIGAELPGLLFNGFAGLITL